MEGYMNVNFAVAPEAIGYGAKSTVNTAHLAEVAGDSATTSFMKVWQQIVAEANSASVNQTHPVRSLGDPTGLWIQGMIMESDGQSPFTEEATSSDIQQAAQQLLDDEAVLEYVLLDPLFQLWLDQAAAVLVGTSIGNTTSEQTYETMGGISLSLQSSEANTQTESGMELRPIIQSHTQMYTAVQAREILTQFVTQMDSQLTSVQPLTQQLQQVFMNMNDAAGPSTSAERSVHGPMVVQLTTPTFTFAGKNRTMEQHQSLGSHDQLMDSLKSNDRIAFGTTASSVDRSAQLLHLLAAKSVNFAYMMANETNAPIVEETLSAMLMNTPAEQVQGGVTLQSITDEGTVKATGENVVRSQYLVQDMSKFMMSNMRVTGQDGLNEARIILHPQHLGMVNIKLTLDNGVLTAQFLTETILGKEMLEQQLPQLRHALQSLGLQVERLAVNQGEQLSSGMFHDRGQQQSSQQSHQDNQQRPQSFSIGMDVGAEIEHVLDAESIDMNEENNSTFHATA